MIHRNAAWHVSFEDARAYARGELSEVTGWSVEKHAESCTRCARRLSGEVVACGAAPALSQIRDAVLAEVYDTARAASRASVHSQAARRPATGQFVGRTRPGTGLVARSVRLGWAVGPALRWPWHLSLLSVVVCAVLCSYAVPTTLPQLLLTALAPAVPLYGVALSYGRFADPVHEIAASTPSGGLRLLLTRTAAVLVVSVPLLGLTRLLLPAAPGLPGAATWLLPCLALTLTALVLGSYVGCHRACALVGFGWLGVLAAPAVAGLLPGLLAPAERPLSLAATQLLTGSAQAAWAAATVLSTTLLLLRRTSFDRLEHV